MFSLEFMDDDSKKRSNANETEWDAICVRCARCCYEKIDFNGKIFYTEKPCAQLDPVTRECRVYRQRNQIEPDCQRLTPETIGAGLLPADCPYVSHIANYPAPVLNKRQDTDK